MDEKNNEEEVTTEIIDSRNNEGGKKSTTGLEENIAAVICYLGAFITGIIFLFLEQSSKFVRFHAMQSTVLFLGLWIIQFILGFIPFFGWFLSGLIYLAGIILWVVLMVKSYQKEYYKLPVVGDLSEDFLAKLNPKDNV
ncbi:DUF4870 domain-containing protein [Pseudogracilibacillus sp. SE30717A]|uniref:DUF4870 domain-containing protein n=1 Tax=Pseudogracilibacillus sp. SE30717A TaxID=3098293 RepID=UPI00300E324A